MSSTQPPRRPALKLTLGEFPAFTADDMRAYLQGAPECSLGPTLTGEPPTVESLEFASSGELSKRLSVWILSDEDAPVCFVVLRGPFHLTKISSAPGRVVYGIPWCNIVGEIYDASTGRLVVAGVNAFRPKRGWSVDWKTRVNAPPRPPQSDQKSVSREQILARIETPDAFVAWLRGSAPDVAVASIYDPVHSMLAEYLWAMLEAFTMYGDSIVWDDGVITWNDLPDWLRALNRAEAHRAGAAPDEKQTWLASEVLEMVDEAISNCPG